MTIPARIIQTGKNRNLSLRARAVVANLKCLNPEFEYLFFDDAEVTAFVQRNFLNIVRFSRAFLSNPKIRFLSVPGGISSGRFYFDLDVLLATGLQELLTRSCVFPFEELTMNQCLRRQYAMDWEIGNYAFGAAADHSFLQAVIQNCVKARRDAVWVAPMMRGIPRLFRSDFMC